MAASRITIRSSLALIRQPKRNKEVNVLEQRAGNYQAGLVRR